MPWQGDEFMLSPSHSLSHNRRKRNTSEFSGSSIKLFSGWSFFTSRWGSANQHGDGPKITSPGMLLRSGNRKSYVHPSSGDHRGLAYDGPRFSVGEKRFSFTANPGSCRGFDWYDTAGWETTMLQREMRVPNLITIQSGGCLFRL